MAKPPISQPSYGMSEFSTLFLANFDTVWKGAGTNQDQGRCEQLDKTWYLCSAEKESRCNIVPAPQTVIFHDVEPPFHFPAVSIIEIRLNYLEERVTAKT